MQIDKDGIPYICGAASKTFSDTQTRWSTIERECYGIVFGLEKFDEHNGVFALFEQKL